MKSGLSRTAENPQALTWERCERTVRLPGSLECELGGTLNAVDVRFVTHGTLAPARDNVVWVLHPLTCNADPLQWWSSIVGAGRAIDPRRDYIVCANTLGSCYGSTGPTTLLPGSERPYGRRFPVLTMRDVVQVHERLRQMLGIDRIQLGIGASYGGQQLTEWLSVRPDLFHVACIVGATHRQSPWAVAFHESQRMALEADPTFGQTVQRAGAAGLAAARSIAVLSYRTPTAYNLRQAEPCDGVADNFRASSYQRHIGARFTERFDAGAYWHLTKIMDSHNVARGRSSASDALGRVIARTLFIGLKGDLLFPPDSVRQSTALVPGARYTEIRGDYGHDSILTHAEEIGRHVAQLRHPLSAPYHHRLIEHRKHNLDINA